MFVKLTPRQAHTYDLIWSNPGMRFSNEHPDVDRDEKWEWLRRSFGRSTGLTPPAVPEGWRRRDPERAKELEKIARETGLDEQFAETTFVDADLSALETAPETAEPDAAETPAVVMVAESRQTPVIVIVLAVVAIVLILYLLVK
ncbi:MAG: hypothetical protein LBL24_11050 [Bacteroidales bacterium]|jgi:hypothetical protein|nr:hypothetical protein [Bacteroidales bacterium]